VTGHKWSQYLHRSPSFPLGWVPVAFVACLFGAGIFRIVAARARERRKVLPGAARWARRKELRHLIHGERGSPQRGYVGLLVPERVGIFGSDPVVLRLPERIRCAHCMVVGGPGARKTTGYHKMNLLGDAVDGVSAVVFDLKYPDPVSGFLDCVPIFAREGFDVRLFLRFEEETLALPLIAGVTTVEEAYDVVDVLRPEFPREHGGTWFLRQERELHPRPLPSSARLLHPHIPGLATAVLQGATRNVQHLDHAGGAANAAYGDGRDAAPPAAGSDSQAASQRAAATAEAAARALRTLREWVDANSACMIGHPDTALRANRRASTRRVSASSSRSRWSSWR